MSATIGYCFTCRQKVPMRADGTVVQHTVKAEAWTTAGKPKKDQVCTGSGKLGNK